METTKINTTRNNRLNNIVKFILINVYIILCFIGLFFFGFAFYLWFANWGDLEPGFFVGTGVIVALFGLVISFTSCLGCIGINNQAIKYGFWTGRKIMAIHTAMMIAALVGEIYLLEVSLSATQQYQNVYDQLVLNSSVQPAYVTFESLISDKFNNFFFGAASRCQTTLYYWFWNWVNSNCPSTIEQLRCQGCESYSITFCEANEYLCFANSQDGNPYCPYTICREGILHYFQIRIKPFAIFLLSLTLLQCVLLLMNFMVICFHPRDSIYTIAEKNGTKLNMNSKYTYV